MDVFLISQAEAREDCRDAFEKWGLPDIFRRKYIVPVCTDETPFPIDFILWSVGLNVFHKITRRVTQNGSWNARTAPSVKSLLNHVEANTCPDFLLHIRSELNRLTKRIPSRTNACHGQIPIRAHPDALTPKRPYQREWEEQLFDIQRVYQYLAGGKWVCHTGVKGQFHFTSRAYSVGMAHRCHYVTITFDLETRQFIVHSQTDE